MIFFDKKGNQIREGNLLRRLDKVGKNSKGNGKKFFYSYWVVTKIKNELSVIKVNSKIISNPIIKTIRFLDNDKQILERYEII